MMTTSPQWSRMCISYCPSFSMFTSLPSSLAHTFPGCPKATTPVTNTCVRPCGFHATTMTCTSHNQKHAHPQHKLQPRHQLKKMHDTVPIESGGCVYAVVLYVNFEYIQ